MDKIRVISIFGTRPEAIKLAPVIQILENDPRFESLIVVTAQHREMLDQVLSLFSITPMEDMNLMTENQPLTQLTGLIITALDPIFQKYQPDWIIVQGDTTTAMSASLVAYYHRVKIAHVEAGLRTGDKWQPFPEEANRRIISTIADFHFAPTTQARDNLIYEGIAEKNIFVTGNTIIDALNQVKQLPLPHEIENLLNEKEILSGKRDLVVVTAHRRENFGDPIRSICEALKVLAAQFQNQIEIVYPVHLNPNIKTPVYNLLSGIPNITLLLPLDYLPLIHLLINAKLILTDSGGIQEEATGLSKPCLVLRNITERPEGVEAGFLKLVGTDMNRIVNEAGKLLTHQASYAKIKHAENPYGDGAAAERIVQTIFENNFSVTQN